MCKPLLGRFCPFSILAFEGFWVTICAHVETIISCIAVRHWVRRILKSFGCDICSISSRQTMESGWF